MRCLIWSFCCRFSVCTVVVVVTDDVMPCLIWSFCCRFFVFTTTATSSLPSSSPSTITTIIIMFVVFVLLFLFFRPVRDEMYTLGKSHVRSARSVRYVCLMLPLIQCRWWAFLVQLRKIVEHFLCLPLSVVHAVMSLTLCEQVVWPSTLSLSVSFSETTFLSFLFFS